MSFVRTGRVLLSASLAWTAALGVERCAAEGAAPAEFGAAPVARPIPAPVQAPTTPKQAEPPRTPEQLAAEAEATRLLEEINAAVAAEDFAKLKPLLPQVEAQVRQAGAYDDVAEHTISLGYGLLALSEQRFDDAERSIQAALATAIRAGGRDDVTVAEDHMILASVAIMHRGLEAAKPSLDAAYAIYHKLDDPEDDSARTNLLHLMKYEMDRKRPDLGAAYAFELCDRWSRSKTPDHEDHLLALHALGKFQLELRDLPRARNSFDEAADLSARLNGPSHAETTKLREYARLTGEAFTKTESWGKLIIEAKQLTDGLDVHSRDPAVMRSSIPKLERLIEISKLINQEDGDGPAKWLFILGYIRDQLNDTAEAMRLYREYLVMTDRTSLEPEGEKSAVLLRLARAEANQGDLVQARAHAARVADFFVADPNSAKKELLARKYLTYIECASGDQAAALGHLERYAELARMIRRERLKEEIVFRAKFAYLCGADAKLSDRSRAILDEACRTSAETFGPQSAEAGLALQWLALFQYRAADPTCVETLAAADRILVVAPEDTDVDAGYRRLRVAKYRRAFGQLDQARALYEAELQRLRTTPNPDQNQVAIGLGFLAAIDAHQGRNSQAAERYQEAIDLSASRNDEIAKDLAQFFGKQRDDLAAGRLPPLAPADNADEVAARIMIP